MTTDAACAADLLRAGGVVALPTETVYGLAADATDARAVAQIFALKGRPATNPLIVHVAALDDTLPHAEVTDAARAVAARFWPGPVTLVLARRPTSPLAPAVSAGKGTVAVRVPAHPVFLDVLRQVGVPLAAPSANVSNHTSPTTAQHVLDEFAGRVPVVDGGPCAVGVESTVLDLTGEPTVLRPGRVNAEELAAVLGVDVARFAGSVDPLAPAASPGQFARHYAPRAACFWFTDQPGTGAVLRHGDDARAAERAFYAELRRLDALRPPAIWVELPPDAPPWRALRDRVLRAASSPQRFIQVAPSRPAVTFAPPMPPADSPTPGGERVPATDSTTDARESHAPPRRASKADLEPVLEKARELAELLQDVPEGDLVANVVGTALKLLRDKTNRGDVRLLAHSLAELRYALTVFAPYREQRKVSVFGSARTKPGEPDYELAVEYGRRMAAHGWMVTTGAGGGIMQAAHDGAGREPSFGLAIRLPFEQATNPTIAGDPKLVNFKYFFTRKLMFVRTSHAIALFPGGFGTLDEGFEVLTLVQTGKSLPVPLVMLDKPGGLYWDAFQTFVNDQLLARGLISAADLKLYKICHDLDEAVAEVTNFYKNYHSMRYVRGRLVMRLQRRPSDRALATVRSEWSDIKTEGDFEAHDAALPQERDEVDIAGLPRLAFAFNRRDHGRLRELIDYLNELA